jgi:hypothetical protein
MILFVIEGFLLGSWAIYIAYIRISRFFPSRVDVRLRIFFDTVAGVPMNSTARLSRLSISIDKYSQKHLQSKIGSN